MLALSRIARFFTFLGISSLILGSASATAYRVRSRTRNALSSFGSLHDGSRVQPPCAFLAKSMTRSRQTASLPSISRARFNVDC